MCKKTYDIDNRINNLQKNLPAIELLLNTRGVRIHAMMGVSRQTWSNLATNKNPINIPKYISLLTIIDCCIGYDTVQRNKIRVILDLEVCDHSFISEWFDGIIK